MTTMADQGERKILSIRGMCKSFGRNRVLDHINFDVKKGTIMGLMGENGAGKSTLMKCLFGTYQKDEGTVFLDGKEVNFSGPKDALENGVAMVHQELNQCLERNVLDNLYMGRYPLTPMGMVDEKRMKNEAADLFRRLNMTVNLTAPMKTMSVSARQMVEIAKAISYNAKLIVLDEPTSSLSDNEIENLFRIVRSLQKKGITFIYISHRMEEIQEIGDTASVLRDGEYIGYIEDLRHIDMDEIIRMIVGRKLEDKFPRNQAKKGDVYFEAKNISVPRTIYNISFQVRSGEILGLAGLVGAGRTSTAKAIFGVLPGTTGQVFVNGREVHIRSPQDAIRAGISYLPEDRKNEGLVLTKTVRENITMAALRRYIRHGVIRDKLERQSAKEYSDRLRVKTPDIERLVKFLSGGNQQKVVFAKWLCAQSKVYIFDEPTRGIDVGSKREIYQIINRLAEEGAAIVVISSELPEIIGVCDRIVVLHEGNMMGSLTHEEATQEKIMYYAIGGQDNG